jgi:hypothetical protein
MASPTISVNQARALVQATTFDIFNEHDQAKRRNLMEKYWAADVTCYSPFGAAAGYDALDHVWGGKYSIFLVARTVQTGHFHHLYLGCTCFGHCAISGQLQLLTIV